ncbi:MAG: hypothetical protein IID41_17290, partial [Planctomycetes bacterium]|nr:hypothetical protein [Planctomycetota bacterium]
MELDDMVFTREGEVPAPPQATFDPAQPAAAVVPERAPEAVIREGAEPAVARAADEAPSPVPAQDVPTTGVAQPARIVDNFEPVQAEAIAQVETRPIAGGGDQFTSPLRPFDDVVREVEVPDNPILQSIAAKTGINPSAAIERQRPVTRSITAYYRQLGSGEQLTNIAVQNAFDVHTNPLGRLPLRFRADARTQLTDGEWVAWNDVFSSDRFTSRLTQEQIALRDDYRRVVEEVEFLRTQAGLRPRAVTGPDATKPDGWFYIPRQVDEVRGLSIDRASDPGLQRFYEEAEEGLAKGVRYAEDPRQVLSLHTRNAYREIAAKQLSDHLEQPLISAAPKDLIPARILQRMTDATATRVAAERRVRSLQAQRLRTQVGTTPPDVPPGTRTAEQQVRAARVGERGRVGREIKAAQAELTGAMEDFNSAKRSYSAALKVARKKRIGPGALFGRHEDEIEIGQWRNRFFERGDAELLTEELGTFFKEPQQINMIGRAFKNVGDASRFLSAVGDFAVQFLQGLPLLGRNPVAWNKATLRSFQAWFDPAVQARYIRDNADVLQEMGAHNVPVGDVEFFTAIREGGAPAVINIGEMIERLPGGKLARGAWRGLTKQTFGRFQASYDTFLTIARAELWKGMKQNWQGSLDDLAAHVRNMTGGLDSRALGVGPTQRGVESTWLAFSPRFLRSTV